MKKAYVKLTEVLPEYVDDDDTRLLKDYLRTLDKVSVIVAEHIKYDINTEKARRRAIDILWWMQNHIQKQLYELGELTEEKVVK